MYELEKIIVVTPALRLIKSWIFQMYGCILEDSRGKMKKKQTLGIIKQFKSDKIQNCL